MIYKSYANTNYHADQIMAVKWNKFDDYSENNNECYTHQFIVVTNK